MESSTQEQGHLADGVISFFFALGIFVKLPGDLPVVESIQKPNRRYHRCNRTDHDKQPIQIGKTTCPCSYE